MTTTADTNTPSGLMTVRCGAQQMLRCLKSQRQANDLEGLAMTDKPTYQCGKPERRLVYAWEGEVDGLRAAIERLQKALEVTKSDCAEAFAENDRLRAEAAKWRDLANREWDARPDTPFNGDFS
jgi:hypothetical protein